MNNVHHYNIIAFMWSQGIKEHDTADEIKFDQEVISSTETSTAETDMLLMAIEFACEAIIACATKIDMLDEPSTNDKVVKCGTRLANIAIAIKSAIRKKQFAGLSLSNIIFQISRIFEQYVHDNQAEIYRLFFNIIGRVCNFIYFTFALFH